MRVLTEVAAPAVPSRKRSKANHVILKAAVALVFSGFAAYTVAAPYSLTGLISIPASAENPNPNGSFTSYDIMWVDDNTQLVYLADRSNASVDVFSAKTNTFVGRVGGSGEFVGQNPPLAPVSASSGPNGIVISELAGQHNLYAGDGNSTLKAYNLDNPNVLDPALVSTARVPNTPVVTGAAATDRRVDEMAFDPVDNKLLVTNNAPTNGVPFSTLINTTGNTNNVVTRITFNGAGGVPDASGPNGGAEQSAFDPATGKFYLNLVQLNQSGPGGVVQINPLTGAVEHVYDFATMSGGLGAGGVCGPTGMAVGPGGQLFIGCGPSPTGSLILDPLANGGVGQLIHVAGISGEDMVWFDPHSGLYFTASRTDLGGVPVLGIVDTAGNLLQKVPTSPGAHSVAVDPVSGEVFVPFGGAGPGDVAGSFCPFGCMAIFAAVPEPDSLALIGTVLGLAGVFVRRRRSRYVC